LGIAVETYTMMGFSGLIKAMVGFEPDGTIIDVVHLEHKETPGLGDKIEKSKSTWSNQYKGNTLKL
jgi:Na+-translocating ferredoxin:NAD+ oxidoreductase subunit G